MTRRCGGFARSVAAPGRPKYAIGQPEALAALLATETDLKFDREVCLHLSIRI